VTQHAGGSWLVLDGTVKPKQQGRTVIIDRIGPDGRTKLGTATLTGRSTFELVEKHLTPGTYHLRARVTSSSTSAAAHSKRLTVRL
jgi:hypothetical protein